MHNNGWPPRVPRNNHLRRISRRFDEPVSKSRVWDRQSWMVWCRAQLSLRKLLCNYYSGQARVRGSKPCRQTAKQSKNKNWPVALHSKTELLRSLVDYLGTKRREYLNFDPPKAREAGKGSGRRSTLRFRERSVFNQTNMGIILKTTVGEAESLWTC